MSSFRRRDFLVLAASAPAVHARQALAQQIGGGGWSVRGTDPVEIFFQERRVASYSAGFAEGSPFLEPVLSPAGSPFTAKRENLPGGIGFFLASANGYDFRPGPGDPGSRPGRIVHKGMNGVLVRGPTLAIRVRADWLDAADPTRRVASDRREITFYYHADGSLIVNLELELIADAGDLALGAQEEPFFSVEPAPGLVWEKEKAERILGDSEGREGTEVHGTTARWVACQGTLASGSTAGFAVLDHPSNPGHPATWSIGGGGGGVIGANPFSPEGPPVVIANGQSLRFLYRAIFFEGGVDGIDLSKAYESFSKR